MARWVAIAELGPQARKLATAGDMAGARVVAHALRALLNEGPRTTGPDFAGLSSLALRLFSARTRLCSAIATDDPRALTLALELAALVDELEALFFSTAGETG